MTGRQKSHQKEKQKKGLWKWFVAGGLFFCLLAGAVYFFLFSRFFAVTEIKIEANKDFQYVSADEIKKTIQNYLDQKIFGFVPQNNIIWLLEAKIAGGIKKQFPSIKSIVILKRVPSYLVVQIEEREKIGIWCQAKKIGGEEQGAKNIAEPSATSTDEIILTNETTTNPTSTAKNYVREVGDCYLLDTSGVIFQKASLVTGTLILNVYDMRQNIAAMGEEAVSLPLLNFILDLRQKLSGIKTSGKKIFAESDFEIASLEDVRVKNADAWRVYFNPLNSPDAQIQALQMFLKSGQKFSEYVDLRIEGRAYYR